MTVADCIHRYHHKTQPARHHTVPDIPCCVNGTHPQINVLPFPFQPNQRLQCALWGQ